MELLPPPPDFFGSIDFDILSAEIFHTQEHEDYSHSHSSQLELEDAPKHPQIEYPMDQEDQKNSNQEKTDK